MVNDYLLFSNILFNKSLEDSANLPAPQVLAQEIADDLQAALEQINGLLDSLNQNGNSE